MRLTGLIAAPHTPFREDGSLNPDAIPHQAEHLLTAGVSGVFVCGTTGEGMSLTSAERRAVAERWVSVAAGRFPVVVHVGHASIAEARELTAHAQGTGATAIAAVPPFYHKPTAPAEVADALAEIGSAAPRLPLYLYDIPAFTGVRLNTAEVLERAAAEVPSFAGVKFSNPDLIVLQECLAARGGSLDVLFGFDELLLAALALGVRGAVGGTYNFAAPLHRRIISAFEAGDLPTARQLQRRSVALVRVLERFGFLPASKAVMAMLGVDCGPVRPPVRPLTEPQVAELRDQLTALGLFSEFSAP